jgi:hypothetical protein
MAMGERGRGMMGVGFLKLIQNSALHTARQGRAGTIRTVCAGPPKSVMDFSVARPRKSTRRAAAGFDMRRLQQISDGCGQPPAPLVADGGDAPPDPLDVVDGRDVPQEEALSTPAPGVGIK